MAFRLKANGVNGRGMVTIARPNLFSVDDDRIRIIAMKVSAPYSQILEQKKPYQEMIMVAHTGHLVLDEGMALRNGRTPAGASSLAAPFCSPVQIQVELEKSSVGSIARASNKRVDNASIGVSTML